jgi:DNA invertase Pin-like site-specific DNA recombinase
MRLVTGYVRVSTGEQTFEAQERALTQAAASRGVRLSIIAETASGQRRRTQLDELEAKARRGSVRELWVTGLDRLGRSTVDVLLRLDRLSQAGCVVVSLREGLDLGSAAGRLQAQLLASFAEFEASIIRERTRAGLEAARARGRRLGRPRAELDASAIEGTTVDELRAGGASWASIARRLGVSRATLRRRLAKNGASSDEAPDQA